MFKVICSEYKKDINSQLSNLDIKSVSRPSLIYTHNLSDTFKVCVTVEFNKAVENVIEKNNSKFNLF